MSRRDCNHLLKGAAFTHSTPSIAFSCFRESAITVISSVVEGEVAAGFSIADCSMHPLAPDPDADCVLAVNSDFMNFTASTHLIHCYCRQTKRACNLPKRVYLETMPCSTPLTQQKRQDRRGQRGASDETTHFARSQIRFFAESCDHCPA